MATSRFCDGNPSRSTVRALVVDDFQPFRQFVCSTLRRIPGLQIIGEASDGLEAVQKAEELKPDLILLDVGLPTLNGIEACHRMSSVSARGYVLKADANSELLPAVQAVLRGERFVSAGVTTFFQSPSGTQN